ncbi:DUF4270 domain-containing protein [Pleomorphovibrio marinus]|uniref:DUF4270 domain-containing protein n=1 Tax=Pleomorphovibrio marinus TaxID=2164132 RepID=UPI001E4F1639|nr:DUF4270 domain-containing protein [Pleomorphovibrio marinus]
MVLLDSFNTTSSQGRIIVGGDKSDFFGVTEAIGFSRLSFNPGASLLREDAIFDSAKFSINVSNLEGENFDQPKNFQVHRLTQALLDTTYYNFDKLDYDAENPIASGSFILKPDTVNTLTMDLDSDLAADLFGKLTTNDPVFSNIFTFREYFKGIAIKGNPDENINISANIGGGTGMTIYYHYDEDTVSRTYPINTIQSRHFTHVNNDPSGTPLENVMERGQSFDVPGDYLGSKSGLGLLLKLDTSPIQEFLDTLANVSFNQVQLEIGPIADYPEHRTPHNRLLMYFSTDNNRIMVRSDGALVAVQQENANQTNQDSQGNVVPAVSNQTSLILDTESRVFRNQVTSYINALYRSGLERRDLLVYPRDPNSQGADHFKRSLREYQVRKDHIMLKVYYTKVKR